MCSKIQLLRLKLRYVVYSILIIMLSLQPDTCLTFSFTWLHMAVIFDAQEWRNWTKYIQGVYRIHKHQYLTLKYAINAQSVRNTTSFIDPYEWHPFYANGDLQTIKIRKDLPYKWVNPKYQNHITIHIFVMLETPGTRPDESHFKKQWI